MKWTSHTTRAIKVARLRIAAMILFMLAGLGFIIWPYVTDYRYASAQKALAAEALAEGVSGDTQAGGEPMPDTAMAHILIPDIDLDAYVLEGTEPAQLDRGPGHYEETPLPGEHGNVCIAGHRTMYGRPFNRLDELEPGDEIVLVTETARHVYRVEGTSVVDPRDVSVAAPTDDYRLTLTTCHPERSARERLVVTALLDD
ncbi:MAG: class E sortase [Coriobacteriia bacterium]|nr:class E sortase [Coriobacteriia bacterium]